MEKGLTFDQAMAEAARCLLCHDAPCSQGCPASTAPDKFIRKLRFRNLKGAAAVIKERNILGGICAVVCPTCELCAGRCVATGIGEPIRIGEIQRFLVEYAWQTGFQPLTVKPSNGKKIAVVGGGPAGLTCAAELAKEGYLPVIFERKTKAGGMLQYGIPNHRMTRDFVDREIEDVKALGVEFRMESNIEGQKDLDSLLAEGFQAVFIGTGSWKCTQLNVPNRDSDDLMDAMTFLMLAKDGGSSFSERVKGREIAVIGGGDTAMDAAVCAKKGGAKDVSIIYRRSFVEMPASLDEKQAAEVEGVHFIILTQPLDYVIEGGNLKGMKVVRTRLEGDDPSRRRSPVAMAGTEHTLPFDVIVEAIGLAPYDNVREIKSVEFDGQNRVVVRQGKTGTSRLGVFAGGDAVRGPSIVANAVADGRAAAWEIIKHLESGRAGVTAGKG